MSRPPAKLGPMSSARWSDTPFSSRIVESPAASFNSAVRSNGRHQPARPTRVRRRPSRTGPSSARSAARRVLQYSAAARARTRGPPARAAKRARGAHPGRTKPGEHPMRRRSNPSRIRCLRHGDRRTKHGGHEVGIHGARAGSRSRASGHERACLRSARGEVHDTGSDHAVAVLVAGAQPVCVRLQ